MVTYMQPANPEWPDKDSIDFPSMKLLPIIDRNDSWFRRLWSFLTKRPQYIITLDYFTYIYPMRGWFWCPPNFVYDFASIPKAIPLVNPAGVFAYPALPHDFAYRFGGLFISAGYGQPFEFIPINRLEADNMFCDMAEQANGLYVLDHIATGALKMFAFVAYTPRDVFQEDWSKPVYGND